MTTITQPSHSDVSIVNLARPSLRERVSDRRMETHRVSASAGQQSFAYFHIRKLARRLENDPERLAQWWAGNGIDELGGLTPDQLLAAGQHEPLEAFMRDILAGRRD